MYFLLWTEGSHESTNFDTFKCADEKLPNCSYHFPNHKSIFHQIVLRHSSESWKITPLYFFRSNIIDLAQKTQSKCKFLRLPSAHVNIHQTYFWNNKSIFFKIMHHFSMWWDINFLTEILCTSNKRSLSKYKFSGILCEQSKVWL